MSLLARLESKFRRYSVPNVTLYLVFGMALVYVLNFVTGAAGGAPLWQRLALMPALVLQGEVWRIFTYVFVILPGMNPFFVLIYLFAFYYFGQAVESVWGSFRYNVYLLVGFVATTAAAFAAPNSLASIDYLKTSVFLAFATLLPEHVVRINLILPVKAKWLAVLTWLVYAYYFYDGDWSTRLLIAAAVANFFLFFWRSMVGATRQHVRRTSFRRRAAAGKLVHECRVCGLSSADAPRTQFRYCSQCAGQSCYCPEHLHNHQHVVKESA